MIEIVENPKECNKCNKKIGWHKLKSGKWMPVTLKKDCSVKNDNGDYEYYFECNSGMYKGYTPRHKCSCFVCGVSYSFGFIHEFGDKKMICEKCKEDSN